MIRRVLCSDIVEVPADAMVYSTNVRLALTGGVGESLLSKFGISAQIRLQDQSVGSGRQMADVGDVLLTEIPGSPWKVVFHTVATDEQYHTDPETVRSILKRCFRSSSQRPDISSIATSALGCGYGDLDIRQFALIADEVSREWEGSRIQLFTIVARDPSEFEKLASTVSRMVGWTIERGND
jgi:O-acetyl-ADP-ribose deacetylase (regulator of RNase III)